MSKKNFEIRIEKSNMPDIQAETRLFKAFEILINLNDIYAKENNSSSILSN